MPLQTKINTGQKYFAKKNTYNRIEIQNLINELNKNTSIQFSIVGNNIFVKQKPSKVTKKKII
ncbi:MAG: hypothetical protein ABI793_14180 [Flavobacterium sp.]